MEDVEATDLIEQLRLMEKQAHELVAQQYKVERMLKDALEKAPERQQRIVGERIAPGGEESSPGFST
jgi:hypothetical protein